MKIGIITYTSLHCNFTNYGTVLQAWALSRSIGKCLKGTNKPKGKTDKVVYLVNYCPKSMLGMNPLSPFEKMWDNDDALREQARLTMPSIKENLRKIESFYRKNFNLTENEYVAENIDSISLLEGINHFAVGSDSIWDIEEFGVDDVFFANKEVMKQRSIAYAPSFQDSIENFNQEEWEKVKDMIESNFLDVALRDKKASLILEKETGIKYPVVLDPTLTLSVDEYREIESRDTIIDEPYLMYYSRRYNPEAEKMVEAIAAEKNLKVVEISLRAENATRHIMRYDAGVEEFLTSVKNAEVVVTNSFHCMIFSILYKRDFYAYSRPHCCGKIVELLNTLGLSNRYVDDLSKFSSKEAIDFQAVEEKLEDLRTSSLHYLENAIKDLADGK